MRLRQIFFLLVVLASPQAAFAAGTPADKLIDEGIELRIAGQYREAFERFQRAHALSPSALTLAQMALAEADLKRWVDAETHIARALAARGTPWIENTKNRGLLEKTLLLIRSHIGLVAVAGPDGTDVTVDGRAAGRLPLDAPLHIPEGTVRMEGKAEGRQSAATDVVVTGGGEAILRLDLPLVAIPTAPTPSVPEAVRPREPGPSLVDVHPVVESSSWKTGAGIGLLVAAAGLLTWGIVWVAIDGNSTSCGTTLPGAMCPVYDTGTKGWVLAGIGAATGVSGGVLLYLDRRSPHNVILSMNSTGAIVLGTF